MGVSGSSEILLCNHRQLDLSSPRVMGILNVTPDSFSDGGQYSHLDAAIHHAERMLNDGAAIIDVGGESTRPGADVVSEQAELDRVAPVVEKLVEEFDALISVDTSTPAVMLEAARLGAGMINDVRSLKREGALEAAARTPLAICLMHMVGEPDNMQHDPYYEQAIEEEVASCLAERLEACLSAGIAANRIVLDPGFGFAKTLTHNLCLMNRLECLNALKRPLLVGVSRKSMIGKTLDRNVDARLAGGLALASMAVARGARIIRTHDVAPTVDAVNMTWAVLKEGS
ncbi:dihydropteroate synthase [Phytohalomonas tamaricis]|uniref:dihydropteroate synthase n=1 Tax=Phytohalomonas tamaricis TaxID=2081032 RepID=UPI0021D42537|nr:dihydropteroate synthase [Phytohalomonas tamaricis]